MSEATQEATPEIKIDERTKMAMEAAARDLRVCLRAPEFRRFIWRVMEEAGVLKNSAHNSGSWTYFNEGQRQIGIWIKDALEQADPLSYAELMLEAAERKKNHV